MLLKKSTLFNDDLQVINMTVLSKNLRVYTLKTNHVLSLKEFYKSLVFSIIIISLITFFGYILPL